MSRQDANAAFARTSFLYGGNAAYVEKLQSQFEANPSSVDAEWRAFFEMREPAPPLPGSMAYAHGQAPANGNGVQNVVSIDSGKKNGQASANGNGNGNGASHLARASAAILETAGTQGRVFQLINAFAAHTAAGGR